MAGFTQGGFSYTKTLRIVVDTNFLIHVYLNPTGYTADVLQYIKANHTLIMSDYILDETLRTAEKIANKYNFSKRDFDLWRLNLPYLADEMIILPDNFYKLNKPNIRDIKDVGIFVTVLLSRSQLLISNDKDLVQNEEIEQYVDVVRLEDFKNYIARQISQEERNLLERLVHKHVNNVIPQPKDAT
jgi:putative PIN family toxin of toxin-antitoxin system